MSSLFSFPLERSFMTSAPDTTTLPAKMQSPASSTPVPLSTAKQLKPSEYARGPSDRQRQQAFYTKSIDSSMRMPLPLPLEVAPCGALEQITALSNTSDISKVGFHRSNGEKHFISPMKSQNAAISGRSVHPMQIGKRKRKNNKSKHGNSQQNGSNESIGDVIKKNNNTMRAESPVNNARASPASEERVSSSNSSEESEASLKEHPIEEELKELKETESVPVSTTDAKNDLGMPRYLETCESGEEDRKRGKGMISKSLEIIQNLIQQNPPKQTEKPTSHILTRAIMLVYSIITSSPADEAGLQVRDLVTKLGPFHIDMKGGWHVNRLMDVATAIAKWPAGTPLPITALRMISIEEAIALKKKNAPGIYFVQMLEGNENTTKNGAEDANTNKSKRNNSATNNNRVTGDSKLEMKYRALAFRTIQISVFPAKTSSGSVVGTILCNYPTPTIKRTSP